MNYELSNYYFSVSFVVSRDYPIDYVTQFFTNGNILSDNLNAIRLLHCSQAEPAEGISTIVRSIQSNALQQKKINQIIDNDSRSVRLPLRQAATTFLLTSNESQRDVASEPFIHQVITLHLSINYLPSPSIHSTQGYQLSFKFFFFCFFTSQLRCKSTNFEPIFLHISFDDQMIQIILI